MRSKYPPRVFTTMCIFYCELYFSETTMVEEWDMRATHNQKLVGPVSRIEKNWIIIRTTNSYTVSNMTLNVCWRIIYLQMDEWNPSCNSCTSGVNEIPCVITVYFIFIALITVAYVLIWTKVRYHIQHFSRRVAFLWLLYTYYLGVNQRARSVRSRGAVKRNVCLLFCSVVVTWAWTVSPKLSRLYQIWCIYTKNNNITTSKWRRKRQIAAKKNAIPVVITYIFISHILILFITYHAENRNSITCQRDGRMIFLE